MANIRILPLREEHATRLLEAAHESIAEVGPWMPWCRPGFSEADARGWVSMQQSNWSERSEFQFAIEDESGAYLGGCGINFINPIHRFANVGYWVRTSAAGRGVATNAVGEMTRFAEHETNLIRLEIVVALGNDASARVAEKSGAKLEGVLRNRLWLHDAPRDARMYSVLIQRTKGRT
jgi:RimJ/RimL family protein N-acetyltransferase